jgi:hypothetical protein
VNATASGEALRVVLDNQLVANTVLQVAGYFGFNSGEHTAIFQTEAGEELARATFTLEPAARVTAALIGSNPSNYQVLIHVDDATPVVRNTTRVYGINAIVDSGAHALTINGEAQTDPVGFGEATASVEFTAGSYELGLEGKTPTEFVFSPGRYYLMFFIGANDTDTPRLFDVIGRPFNATGFNQYRFMNVVGVEEEGAEPPELEVYVNQDPVPVFTNVRSGQATGKNVVAPGNYTFDVYLAGSDPDSDTPLASIEATIAENQSVFVIANGRPDNIRLNVFADDVTPVPVNTARLQVINLSEAVPEFGLVAQNDIQYIDQISQGSMATVNVPGGSYAWRLVNPDNPNAVLGQAETNAPSGSLATLVIHGVQRLRYVWFNEPIEQVATVRVVHASPTAPTVDIYLNGDLILNNLSYLDFTEYLTLTPANYELTVYPDGVTPEDEVDPLWQDNLNITGNAVAFTMVAMGTDNFRVNVYPDNLEIIPPGQARIRFVHAVQNVPALSVINAANGGVLAGGLGFGQGSDNLNVNANTRTFNFSNTGVGVFYRVESFPLAVGGHYTFIAIGDANDPESLGHILLEIVP